ncbi:MAG TPA: hypothetical protein VLE95_07865 [Chlamydiales bacterium]|nr:hypothetical protein [Chlamydiales bacterium]
MLVQPPKFIEGSLAAKINEAKIKDRASCFDDPKIAAVHLKTKEDLSMFYGESHASDFTVAVTYGIQVVVAVIATAVAAVTGNSNSSSHELSDPLSEDVFGLSVHDLLNARRSALEIS